MQSFLVVEDTPAMLKWLLTGMRRMLPKAVSFGVTNRTDALSHVERHRPELVILDLAIPETPDGQNPRAETGLSVLDALAGLSDRPRVVVFSSFALRDECLQRGADGFVSKGSREAWSEIADAVLVNHRREHRVAASPDQQMGA